MKKAEIIKNGNVNLKQTQVIDWEKLKSEYFLEFYSDDYPVGFIHIPRPIDVFDWFKNRLTSSEPSDSALTKET